MKIKIILFVAVVILIAATTYFYSSNILISEQFKLVKSMREVSAVIFGVMGIWVAIVYPQALREILKRNTIYVVSNERVRKIFFPIKMCTFIVMGSLFYEWMMPILMQIDEFRAHATIFRNISFILISIAVFGLVWSLLYSLLPLANAEDKTLEATRMRESVDRRRSGTNKN